MSFRANIVIQAPGSNADSKRSMNANAATRLRQSINTEIQTLAATLLDTTKRPASLETEISFTTYNRTSVLQFFRRVLRGTNWRASMNVWTEDTRQNEPFASVSLGPNGMRWSDDGPPTLRQKGSEGRP